MDRSERAATSVGVVGLVMSVVGLVLLVGRHALSLGLVLVLIGAVTLAGAIAWVETRGNFPRS